jgi:hypothetical protein
MESFKWASISLPFKMPLIGCDRLRMLRQALKGSGAWMMKPNTAEMENV